MTTTVVLIMGATATGKTTLGEALAKDLSWPFLDGDTLHSPENIAKMTSGQPLTDADRAPWLARVTAAIASWQTAGTSGVIACSALKRGYRDQLRCPGLLIMQAWAPPEVLRDRVAHRPGHFMPPGLLDSQLATLEDPAPDEAIPRIDTTQPLSANIAGMRAAVERQPH
jgi:gluconokinase